MFSHIQKNYNKSLDKKNLTKMYIKHYFFYLACIHVQSNLIQSLITARIVPHDFAKN